MFSNSVTLSRRRLIALGMMMSVSGLAFAGPAYSQDWPSRPVTMVVPYNPGASNDTFTRALSEILSRDLGQPFVVDNRPGAGGFTGANTVVQSDPDGYTFLQMPNSIAGFKPIMKVDLDPLVNLTPIALMAKSPTAMLVPSSLPVETVQEFIDYAKANPDKTFYGYAGIGTTQHQHGELFNTNAGLTIKGVNYSSSADAQTDLVAGRLSLMFVTVASARGQLESGQLRLLAYTDDNYPEGSPEAPTMAEAGVDGMQGAQIFWALFAPVGMSEELQNSMNEAVNKALGDEEFQALLARSGATAAPGSPQDLVDTLNEENRLLAEFLERVEIE